VIGVYTGKLLFWWDFDLILRAKDNTSQKEGVMGVAIKKGR
jgi:hypothetical protein